MTAFGSKVRPVRLEINRRGSWMTVTKFDAGSEDDADSAQSAAVLLSFIDGTNWRICTDEALPVVLMRLSSAREGWRPASEAMQ